MTSSVRIVFTNGRSIKRKIIGQRLSWLIVKGKRRKVYYPIHQIRTINYRTVDDFGFTPGTMEMEALVWNSL
ncbi:MAG: hypothetical protein LVQ63_07010 [Thermoplasmatales archaeon]|nr:hypothetical protein [Thermoplasmatales archaeon]